MKGRFGNKQRLEHALDAISEIDDYIANQNFPQFLTNSMMRFACIKQLEIIGEACNHIDLSVKEIFSEVEWRKVTGLRHILVHEYFGVGSALIWDIVTNDLPNLKLLPTHIAKTL